MKEKKIKSVFKYIGAVFISLILILISVAVPITFSLTRLTETETVVNIVQHMNYEEIIRKNKELEKMVTSAGLKADTVNDIMQTETAKNILSAYAETATAVLEGATTSNEFNAETIKTIVNNNIDELASIEIDEIPKSFPKKQIKKSITEWVDKNADLIVEIFPDISSLHPTTKTIKTVSAIKTTFSPLSIVILLVLVLSICTAIFFLRRKSLRWLLWLGIDFFIAALILCGISVTAKIGINALSVTDLYSGVFGAAASFCTERIIWSIFSVLLLAVCLLVSFILIRGLKNENPKEADL